MIKILKNSINFFWEKRVKDLELWLRRARYWTKTAHHFIWEFTFLKVLINIIITVTWSEVSDHVKLTGTDHQIKRDAEQKKTHNYKQIINIIMFLFKTNK